MAPSTAFLFLLFGLAGILRVKLPLNRFSLWTGSAIGCGGMMVASLLFVLAFMDIHWKVEHLGFDITDTVGRSPIGHMSTVTAIGFILASISFIASLPSSYTWSRRIVLALGMAGLLLGMSLVFLLAYLFGKPLLYGGKLIPPAFNTLLAFAMLSFSLLISAWNSPGIQGRRTEGAPESLYLLLSIFILLSAGIINLGTMMGFLMFGAGVSMGLVLWRQRIRFSLERAEGLEALRQNEEKFRAIANYTVDWESWIGLDGKFLWVNPGVEQITGYSADEILAMPDFITTVIAEEDRAMFIDRFQNALKGEKGHDFDFRYYHKNGSKYWLSASWQPIFDTKGRPLGLRASGRDITKRKLTEEALRESENRFHSLFIHMTEGVALHEMVYAEDGKPLDYRIIDVNPAYELHTGIKAEDARGRLATEVYHVATPPFIEQYERVARTGTPYLFENEVPLLNRIFSVSAYSPKQGWFATVFTDITQRVKTEESHARLVTAVEQAVETIVITDAEGKILYANPAFEKTTGYTREESLGQNPRMLKSGKHHAAFYQQMWEVLSDGKVWTGRIVNKRKDGVLYEEDASISPVFDATGEIINFVAVKRDITREVQLEQQFLQVQKMEAIGRLAGGVAHDFNNLLSVILMNASELSTDKTVSPEHANDLSEIIGAAERGANLTRQMLAFSHRQVMQVVALSLNGVVESVTKMLQRLIGEDIILLHRLSSEDEVVQGDAGMIEQVLLNLVVNARDAMPEGGQIIIELDHIAVDEATASTHHAKAGEFVRLTVRDTGCGIPPEHLTHIFEPFYTTKDPAKGTGLGLATVHGIIEQHHGWVEVESVLGQGTAFHILLPRLLASPQVVSQNVVGGLVHGGNGTILLVEDEQALRMLAVRVLKQQGYRVLEAPQGNGALELWQQHKNKVDLLLTDVIMPGGISGGKLAEQLLAEKPGLKVVFMSGYPGDMSERGLNLHHGHKFLQKPFLPAKLVQTVQDSLNRV